VSQNSEKKRGGKPFRSKLAPHWDFLREERRKGKTWVELSELLKGLNVEVTPQGVFYFFKSRRKKHYALGMEPEEEPREKRVVIPTPSPLQDAPTTDQFSVEAETKDKEMFKRTKERLEQQRKQNP
jgi:hypothetical protein